MDDKTFHSTVMAKMAELMAQFSVPEGVTPAEIEAIKMKVLSKAKSIVKQEERDAALTKLVELAKSVASDDPEIAEACRLLEKKARAERGASATRAASAPRISRFTILDQEFGSVGAVVHEDAMYAKYKMGRKDLYWLIADAIKGSKDVNARKWISFDPTSGNYTYEAQGALPPDGWTGYVPANLKAAKVVEATPTAEASEF